MKQNKNKGIFYIIVSAFCFSVMGLFIKYAGDVPAAQKAFIRNFLVLLVALLFFIKKGEKFHIEKENIKDLIIRSLAGTSAIWCNLYAVDHLLLSDAAMLNKMAPFFVIVFSAIILKEKVKKYQWIAVIVAFLGSFFVIKPSYTNIDLFPSLIGFAGGLSAGMSYTFVRKLGTKGVTGLVVVIFFSAFSCIAMVPACIASYTPMTGAQLLFIILAGISAALGEITVTVAYYNAPARDISVYDYSQVIFSALLGLVVFGQMPDMWSFIGYSVIILTSVWVFRHDVKK